MMDFAAATAAATTRLSVGNEQVFNNFTPEKMTSIFMRSLFFWGAGSLGLRRGRYIYIYILEKIGPKKAQKAYKKARK